MLAQTAAVSSVGFPRETSNSRQGAKTKRVGAGAQLTSISFAANQEIYGAGEPAGDVYRVISGAVRVYRLLSDGRRQICAFYLPGDLFGLEATDSHQFSAEAINRSKILVLKLNSFVSFTSGNSHVASDLWESALRSLGRSQEHSLLLGRKTAVERIATFLLEMAERQGSRSAIELPMSRFDIADYLGLTLETVSRMFSELKELGLIGLRTARRVELFKPSKLEEMSA